jgi:hypothetical protein
MFPGQARATTFRARSPGCNTPMPDRIAIKRPTASDLTFFETLFRTINAGSQNAINLNR